MARRTPRLIGISFTDDDSAVRDRLFVRLFTRGANIARHRPPLWQATWAMLSRIWAADMTSDAGPAVAALPEVMVEKSLAQSHIPIRGASDLRGDSRGGKAWTYGDVLREDIVIGTGIALRDDFDAVKLRRLARLSENANQSRRLLALAEIYDGGSRNSAARLGSVGRQIVRDWIVRFNARGPDGLIDGKAPGKKSKLDDAQRQALAAIVDSGPDVAVHGIVRWRLVDLAQWISDEFKISVDHTTVSRELRKLGYVKLSARPRHHAQDTDALEAFEKGALPPNWKKSVRASRKAP